jgi:hypothetical protein
MSEAFPKGRILDSNPSAYYKADFSNISKE